MHLRQYLISHTAIGDCSGQLLCTERVVHLSRLFLWQSPSPTLRRMSWRRAPPPKREVGFAGWVFLPGAPPPRIKIKKSCDVSLARLLQRSHVDDEAILHVALEQAFVGIVDLL